MRVEPTRLADTRRWSGAAAEVGYDASIVPAGNDKRVVFLSGKRFEHSCLDERYTYSFAVHAHSASDGSHRHALP